MQADSSEKQFLFGSITGIKNRNQFFIAGSGSFFNYAGTNKNSSTIMMRITNPRLSKNKSLSISGSYLSNNVPYNVIGSGLNLSSSSFDGICYIQNGGSNATTTIEVWAI